MKWSTFNKYRVVPVSRCTEVYSIRGRSRYKYQRTPIGVEAQATGHLHPSYGVDFSSYQVRVTQGYKRRTPNKNKNGELAEWSKATV